MDALIAMEYIAETKEIEIGQLIMRYGHIRVHRPEIASSLMNSVERCGQIIPVITVKESDLSFVLIDGYLRVAALKRCGKDTVAAEIWQCNEQNALIRVLMKNQERRWEPLEEALLIKELLGQHNISQAKIAQLMGRNQSWISRRIALVHALPDEILGLVQKGRISTWAATRVLAPMARAIPDHAKALAENLIKEPISTRDLMELYHHYQRSNRKLRDRIVKNPGLFKKALHTAEQDNQATILKQGPEGKWLKDLRLARHIFSRLTEKVPIIFYKGQERLERRALLTAFEDTRKAFLALEQEIRSYDSHENCRDKRDYPDTAYEGGYNQRDQPYPQHLQEHCETGPEGKGEQPVSNLLPLRGDQTHHPGVVQTLPG